MSDRPLAEKHEALRREAREAGRRYGEARRARDSEWKLSAELLAPIWDRRWKDKRPTDWLRKFTEDLLKTIKEGGLAFDLTEEGTRSLVLIDPAVRQEVADAGEARAEVARRLKAFEKENADALRAEEAAAEAQQIRDALQGDDPAAIREALTGAAA